MISSRAIQPVVLWELDRPTEEAVFRGLKGTWSSQTPSDPWAKSSSHLPWIILLSITSNSWKEVRDRKDKIKVKPAKSVLFFPFLILLFGNDPQKKQIRAASACAWRKLTFLLHQYQSNNYHLFNLLQKNNSQGYISGSNNKQTCHLLC